MAIVPISSLPVFSCKEQLISQKSILLLHLRRANHFSPSHLASRLSQLSLLVKTRRMTSKAKSVSFVVFKPINSTAYFCCSRELNTATTSRLMSRTITTITSLVAQSLLVICLSFTADLHSHCYFNILFTSNY